MRKLFFLLLLVVFSAPLAFAQTGATDDRKWEFYVGYANLQAEGLPPRVSNQTNTDNTFSNSLFGDRTGLHGFETAATGYVTRRFGITGDFSFNQHTRSFNTTPAGLTTQNSLDTRVINILGGPHVRFPNTTRTTPFLHALFGVAYTRFEAQAITPVTGGTVSRSFATSATDFAMALGGGLDVRVNNRVSVRALQLDYNPIFLRERSVNVLGAAGAIQPQRLESNRQDNIRIGAGVVFK